VTARARVRSTVSVGSAEGVSVYTATAPREIAAADAIGTQAAGTAADVTASGPTQATAARPAAGATGADGAATQVAALTTDLLPGAGLAGRQ
jgi:hypothetical protein